MKKYSSLVLSGLVAGMFASATAMAVDSIAPKGDDVETIGKQIESEAGEHDLEKIGKQMNNPVGAAWMMWTQDDLTLMGGDAVDGHKNWNSLKFQPVMSIPFKMGGDPWNFIIRPTFQYQSFSFAGERTTDFGDTALDIAIGPDRTDGTIWGLGVATIFPTAGEDEVGQGKYQAGPALLYAHLAPKVGGFNRGIFAQHWWSYAGDDDRPETSLTDIQYFIQYRLNKTATIGMAPNIQYDWKADSDDALKLPIGLGYQNVIKIGNTPVKFGIELQYYVVKPDDFGPEWNLRFIFVPVVQSPLNKIKHHSNKGALAAHASILHQQKQF